MVLSWVGCSQQRDQINVAYILKFISAIKGEKGVAERLYLVWCIQVRNEEVVKFIEQGFHAFSSKMEGKQNWHDEFEEFWKIKVWH
jgi:hypothetical protein